MTRLITATTVRIDQAAFLLGMDKNTLMRALQEKYFSDLGLAFKTDADNEAYTYTVYKYPLFTRLGLDVRLPIDEVVDLVKQGRPPWIDQTKVVAQIKKDTPTVQSVVSSLVNS